MSVKLAFLKKGLEKIVPQAFHQSNEWLPTGVLDLRLTDREGAGSGI